MFGVVKRVFQCEVIFIETNAEIGRNGPDYRSRLFSNACPASAAFTFSPQNGVGV